MTDVETLQAFAIAANAKTRRNLPLCTWGGTPERCFPIDGVTPKQLEEDCYSLDEYNCKAASFSLKDHSETKMCAWGGTPERCNPIDGVTPNGIAHVCDSFEQDKCDAATFESIALAPKCIALRDDFLVCSTVPPDLLLGEFAPVAPGLDVLMPRENVKLPCYTVLTNVDGPEKVEVCAPTRKDAHLRMQEIAKDGLAISKEVFQMKRSHSDKHSVELNVNQRLDDNLEHVHQRLDALT